MSFIALTGVGFHTPDGVPLFSNLNLEFGAKRTGLVGRNGVGKSTLLRLIAGSLLPTAGSIVTHGTLGSLEQDFEFRKGRLVADLFDLRDQLNLWKRAEEGLASLEELALINWTLESQMTSALASVGLSDIDAVTPLENLSGGQRTRAAFAAVLFAKPSNLILDEPTNHLDQEGRQFVIGMLRERKGGAIVASHDRELLAEMDEIVELTTLGIKRYGGNFDFYREAKQVELAAAVRNLDDAERDLAGVKLRTQQATQRKSKTDKKGRNLRKSGSQAKVLLDAAKSRSEKSGGASARMRQRQIGSAQAEVEKARAELEHLQSLNIDIESCRLPRQREVLAIDKLCFSYDNSKPLLNNVSFSVKGPERIAISGANGAGKSTLLACVSGELKPVSGDVSLHVPTAKLDQDLSLFRPADTLISALERFDPLASDNQRRATLARFMFRGAEAQKEIARLSGGQRLRAGLACTLGLSQPPQLLVLDEPTNHLDLDTMEILETALSHYDGAMLVVSHDKTFLSNIKINRTISL